MHATWSIIFCLSVGGWGERLRWPVDRTAHVGSVRPDGRARRARLLLHRRSNRRRSRYGQAHHYNGTLVSESAGGAAPAAGRDVWQRGIRRARL